MHQDEIDKEIENAVYHHNCNHDMYLNHQNCVVEDLCQE